MSESQLCWAPFVWGEYRHFVPIYIASILRSYPDSYVRAFVHGELQQDLLDHLRSQISDRFEIHAAAPLQVRRWEHRMATRWFLPRGSFAGFRYGYIGDVDILVLREPEGITAPHADHAQFLGVPYSNIVRAKGKRLTGLHFIEVEPYYERMAAVLDRCRDDEPFCSRNNETVLYDMVQEGIGLPLERMQQRPYRPHHGIHLGLFRERGRHESCRRGYHDSGETRQAQSQFAEDEPFLWLLARARERCRGSYLRDVFPTLQDLLTEWD